jgi:hypothetical protein
MKKLINISILILTISISGFCQKELRIDTLSILHLDSLDYPPYDTMIISGFKKEIDKIIRFDTLNENRKQIKTIIGLDCKNDTILKVSTHIITSLAIGAGPKIRIYNSNGLILLEEFRDVHGTPWHRYIFEYDDNNRLIIKEGYSSGEIGIRIEYLYNLDGKLTEKVYSRFGNEFKREKIE